MDEKCCLVLGIILCLTVISESREIARRALSKDVSHENGEIPLSINPLEKGKKLGLKPAILGPPSVDEDYYYDGAIDPVRRPPENDYNEPERGVVKIDSRFPTGREWGERPQGNPKEKDDTDKPDDDNFNKPLDEEDSKKPGSNDKDAGPSFEEENPIYKDRDESGVEYTGAEESEEENSDKEYEPEEEEKPDEERKEEEEENDDKEHIPEGEEKPDEERKEEEEADEKHEQGNDDEERKEEEKHEPENDDDERKEEEEKQEPENDDEKKYVPEEELVDDDTKEEMPKEVDEETENGDKDDESISKDGEEGSSSDGSIFDTPFFNLERVKKYFGHLDRALGHVFSETVDEALMLNGTVTNTTAEEVDIDGKKFIITKSLIKGGDNTSSIYIEALSAKPKMNDSKVMEDTE